MANIVFIDDDPFVLTAYQRIMRHSGHQCYFLQQAELLWQQEYLADLHIVFTDQMMPGCSGTELLHRLQLQYPDIKRVLLSGDIEVVNRLAGSTLKIHDMLAKPFNKARLLHCIDAVITEKVG
jgi:DNA-binding NtrC family response regulator